MKKFSAANFSEVFKTIGLLEGDTLLVHNSLLSFGIPADVKVSHLPAFIYQHLLEVTGENGTIAVPTFNFNFCKGETFNRNTTPSHGMGAFSEYIRQLPDAKRSTHPMQSVAVVGKNADYIVENDTASAFSAGSAFDRLKELSAKILLLGADFNAISIFHYAEEQHQVPYRYWKNFTGQYVDTDIMTERTYKMFVRSLEANPLLSLYGLEEILKSAKLVQEEKIGTGLVQVVNAVDFLACVDYYMSQNPYFFVSNHPTFGKL